MRFKLFALFAFAGIYLAQLVSAVCPVCTLAVGAGVGVLREYGVDDTLTGIWLGGLIVSSIIWMLSWFDKKKITFLFKKISVIVVFYAMFILPLWYYGIVGVAGNSLWGIDKLVFGTMIGTVVFILAVVSDKKVRRYYEGKAFFPYQKVAFPVAYLVLSSLIAHLLLVRFGA